MNQQQFQNASFNTVAGAALFVGVDLIDSNVWAAIVLILGSGALYLVKEYLKKAN